MKKGRIIALMIILMFSFIGCIGRIPDSFPPAKPCDHYNKESVKYIGYYWGASRHFGNFISDFSNYTNVVYVHRDCEECIPDAIKQGQKVIISNVNDFIHGDLSAWDAYADRIEQYREHIIGFYPFDEPNSREVSITKQEYDLGIIKGRFPEIPIWVCFTASSTEKKKPIVSGYDILSVTPKYGHRSAWAMKGWYDILNSIKHPHQRLYITVDGFSYDRVFPGAEKYKASQIHEYYELAKCLDAIGMLIFIWPSFIDGTGVQDMPIVEEAIIDVSKEIR